jgi:hypothetical protein
MAMAQLTAGGTCATVTDSAAAQCRLVRKPGSNG